MDPQGYDQFSNVHLEAIIIFSDTEVTLHSFKQATFSHVNISLKQKNSTQLKPEFFSIHGFIHDFSRFLNMSIWLSGNECQGCNHILTWTCSPSNIWPTTLVLCLGSWRVKVHRPHLWQGWAVHDCLDVALLEVLGSMVRINGLFHLLINGVYWGYNSLTNHLQSSWYIQVGGCHMKNQQKYTDEQKKEPVFPT